MKKIDLYLYTSMIILTSFVCLNFAMNGELFSRCVWNSSFLFSDYFYHIAGSSDTANMYALGDPYSFPPFAYFLYVFLWKLNPYTDAESILNWKNYMSYDNVLLIFVIYNMMCVLLLLYVIEQYVHNTSCKYIILFPMTLLLSYPFMCTSIQRGNSTLFVGMLIALVFRWMDSENKIKSELAMLLIAVSAGFKIYPALLGLIYVKRKDWKRLLRLIVYGILVIFVPFVFFGGLKGFRDLVATLTGFASYGDSEKTNTIWGFVKYGMLKMNATTEIADLAGIIGQYAFVCFSLVGFFYAKEKWKESYLISAVLVSFLPSNWDYTLTYYLGAFFLFLISDNENVVNTNQKISTAKAIFLVICFTAIFSLDWPMVYFRYGMRTGIFLITYVVWFICLTNSLKGRIIPFNLQVKKPPIRG